MLLNFSHQFRLHCGYVRTIQAPRVEYCSRSWLEANYRAGIPKLRVSVRAGVPSFFRINLAPHSATTERPQRTDEARAQLQAQQKLEEKAAALTVQQIFDLCRIAGVELCPDGGRDIVVKGHLPSDVRQIIQLRKADLLARLESLKTEEHI